MQGFSKGGYTTEMSEHNMLVRMNTWATGFPRDCRLEMSVQLILWWLIFIFIFLAVMCSFQYYHLHYLIFWVPQHHLSWVYMKATKITWRQIWWVMIDSPVMYAWPVNIVIFIWVDSWAGKIRRIMCFDWLSMLTRRAYPACPQLPAWFQ